MLRSLRLSLILELKLRKIEPHLESLQVIMLKSISTNIMLLMLLSFNPREMPRLKDLSMLKPKLRLLSLSELEVSTNLPQNQRRSCNFLD